jgi:hypothetical protein
VIGEVPRSAAEDWLPSGTDVAVANVRGDALRRWVAALGSKVGVAGYDPASNRIGGRVLRDGEVYRVATTDNFAFNEAFSSAFASGVTTDFRLEGDKLVSGGGGVTIAALGCARREAMSVANGGFAGNFRRDFEALLDDDGRAVEPRWSVSLNPLDLSFQDSSPYNATAFSGVAHSRITAPASQTLRSKATAAIAYDGPEITWENSTTLKYDAATITAGTSQQFKQLTNELRLGSAVFANSLATAAPGWDARLVPYGELAYVTEIVPGTNAKTGTENPRRQDTLATAGLALKGTTWLRELKAGFQARRNFAVSNKDIEPGGAVGLSLGQQVGNLDLSLDALVDAFMPVSGDTAADLGLSGQFGAAVKVPLGGGLALRIGVDGLVFRGKVPATDTFGAVITPSIGLTFGMTWKPLTGVAY